MFWVHHILNNSENNEGESIKTNFLKKIEENLSDCKDPKHLEQLQTIYSDIKANREHTFKDENY